VTTATGWGDEPLQEVGRLALLELAGRPFGSPPGPPTREHIAGTSHENDAGAALEGWPRR
jgi:hypothetical protein